MAFLLRVELPDVPGSLGAVASALGAAGADIEAIEIVEHGRDGIAVDDVLLQLPPQVMPDALVTACHRLDHVRVLWISRYTAGASLRMDLEAVEEMTEQPASALSLLVDTMPQTFHCDWAMLVRRADSGIATVLQATGTAPDLADEVGQWFAVRRARRLPEHPAWPGTVLAAAPVRETDALVFGRRGGPEILDSELARLGHLCALAAAIAAGAQAPIS